MDVSRQGGLFLVPGIATVLLAAQLAPRTDKYVPVISETLCWTLVGLWFRVASQPFRGWGNVGVSQSVDLKRLAWVVAIFIAVTALFSVAVDISVLIPIIAPSLIALRNTSLLPKLPHPYPRFICSSWIQFCIGISSVAVLLPVLEHSRYALIIMAILSLIGLFASLIILFEPTVDLSDKQVNVNGHAVVASISYRAIALLLVPCLGLILSATAGVEPALKSTLVAGCLSACQWIIFFYIVQEVPWEIAPLSWTFSAVVNGVSGLDTPTLFGVFTTFVRVVIAIATLFQVVALVPKFTRRRYLLLIFTVWPVFLLVKQAFTIDRENLLPEIDWARTYLQHTNGHHPIEDLILKGQADLENLVNRQSRTLEEAEVEYRRRYSRNPPPGFDKWFAYAQAQESVIIDDFDMINDNLRPFWKLSPSRLNESMNHVTKFSHLSIQKCRIQGGAFHGPEGEWITEDVAQLLEGVIFDIPEVEFAMSTLDEPREIISQEILESGGTDKPAFQLEGHHSIWDRVSRPCPPDPPKSNPSLTNYGMTFVEDAKLAKDLCLNPGFEYMHGLFSSPETCKTTNAPVPILSQAAPSTYGDIIFPSPWYPAKYRQRAYKENEDPTWEDKTNNLYWAGSTTGSHSTNGSWKFSHRQRFVDLVQSIHETPHKYLREKRPGVWESYKAIEDIRNLFDVKLTAVIQCDDPDCDEQKRHFNIGDREGNDKLYHSRFLFDLDGNSFSGRFYTLLQSRSVVLKQTVLREWHDDRLIPWVHYVPVSMGMEELPEIMRYLTTNEDGQKRAEEIARVSREWRARVLRRADFTLYIYRLLLELARVMEPNRQVE